MPAATDLLARNLLASVDPCPNGSFCPCSGQIVKVIDQSGESYLVELEGREYWIGGHRVHCFQSATAAS